LITNNKPGEFMSGAGKEKFAGNVKFTKGIKPFYISGGDTGCLLLHGFSGSPLEMRPLGEYLAARGITVAGVRLAGHGTRPADLKGLTWHDWVKSAATGLAELKNKCSRVYLVGFSMGGTISLHLAANYRVEGVIAVCAPVYLDLRLYLRHPFRYLLSFKREVDHNIKDPRARKNHYAYKSAPPGAVLQLFKLMRLVRSELKTVSCPALLFHSRGDCIVPPGNGPFILENLTGAADKKLIRLENSGHMAVIDYDKDRVMSEAYRFIAALDKQT
jgi:carboxylesterase